MATAAAPQAAAMGARIAIHPYNIKTSNKTLTRARGPPPPPPPPLSSFPFASNNRNIHVKNYTSFNNGRGVGLAAGSYRRVAMDTPGAYHLIDDETGHKFIVWGGDDDDDDDDDDDGGELEDQHVHVHDYPSSWTTSQEQQKESIPKSTSTSSSFGRLKAHKVDHLVRTINRRRNKPHLDNLHLHSSPPAVKPESKMTTATQSTMSPEDVVSVPRPSDSSLRGWGDGRINESNRLNHRLIDKNFFSRKTFKDLGCAGYVIESLKALDYPRPSHIQAVTFGPIIGRKSCIVSDQSGSGKTLAYLLPIVQRLREEELKGLGKPLSLSPRVVILVPTAELASQVLNVCRSLSKSGVPFRSMVTTGGFRQRTQLENLRQELDVLIATPGRFLFLIKEGFLRLTNLKSAVLDEVDVLFNDEDFEQALESLMNAAPVVTQYVFVTATLPVPIYKKLIEAFPDSEVIMGPGVHRTSPGLEEILIDCSGDENTEKTPETAFVNKKNALLKLVEESPVSKTIIFCNKIETCRKVENVLKRFDRKGSHTRVLPFHAAVDQKTRVANINEFRSSQSKNSSSFFLVCTDRASRGIDFEVVDHVVLFDFPRDPSEYVRRVGRTARGAGGQGKAFIFVVGKQVSLAQRIIERNRKGHPLHDVPCELDSSS